MYPSASEASALHTLADLVRWYNVDPAVWAAFVGQVGDPTDDYRLLAVLPPQVMEAALGNAQKATGEYLTVMQATQVGQVYKLARRKAWVAAGKMWDDWVEVQLWSSTPGPPTTTSATTGSPSTTSTVGERKIKMNGVLDQGDDSEFTLDDAKVTMLAYERYVNLMGGPPSPEQEPTAEQLSAMRRRVETLQLSPYADFAVWVPFAKKNLKALKLKTWTMQQDGSFVAKDLPGPPDHTAWLNSFRVYKTALLMLGIASLSVLQAYEEFIEKVTKRYVGAWHLVASADDRARSEQLGRLKLKVQMSLASGGQPPDGWSATRPWNALFALLLGDEPFWQEQLHQPALTWMARGMRGVPRSPMETYMEDIPPPATGDAKGAAKVRREARKRKRHAEKEELKQLRNTSTSSKQDGGKGGGKADGKGNQFVLDGTMGMAHVLDSRLPAEEEEVTGTEAWMEEPVDGVKKKKGGARRRKPQGGDGGEQGGEGEQDDPIEEVGDTTEEEFKPELDKLPEGLKEYLRKRTFNYLHHFSGAEDKLGKAIEQKASLVGMKVKVESSDIKAGVDLAAEEPYGKQLKKAQAGGYDGYHSGFPCSTFSRARFNPVEAFPPPLRTKDHPYGLPDLGDDQKEEVKKGTIFLARSVEMAGAVLFTGNDSGIAPPVSLENPPPSEVKHHLSAWELPELKRFADYALEQGKMKWAAFPTCLYQRDREHVPVTIRLSAAAAEYPEQLVDALADKIVAHLFKMGHLEWLKQRQVELQTEIRDLSRTASSSTGRPEEPQQVSQEAVMENRVETLLQMGAVAKERRKKLVEAAVEAKKQAKEGSGKVEDATGEGGTKAATTDSNPAVKFHKFPILTKSKAAGAPPAEATDSTPASTPASSATATGAGPRGSATLDQKEGAEPKVARSRSPSRGQNATVNLEEGAEPKVARSRSPRRGAVADTDPVLAGWKGGQGTYERIKPKPKDPPHLGGTRNTSKAVLGLSSARNLGVKVMAAWERFTVKYPDALEVADTYGTPNCEGPRRTEEWKAELKRQVGAQGKPSVSLAPAATPYKSPLDAELLEGWVAKAGDPEVYVVDWVRNGTPLGIEKPIPVCGVYPAVPADEQREADPSADAETSRTTEGMRNYSSVTDNPEEAYIELDRYVKEGFAVKLTMEEAVRRYGIGTVSKLGLILKEKDDGTLKRRIIIDLRRSGGNAKSALPERLTLPRPVDAVRMATFQCEEEENLRAKYRRFGWEEEDWAREWVVIDVSDAFMHLAVAEGELAHCMAPGRVRAESEGGAQGGEGEATTDEDVYIFVALLFGFRTAPLLWSRVAALLARLLQSCVQTAEGSHQVYLDDSLWALLGGRRRRNQVLAFVLTTMAALGVKVSYKKGVNGKFLTEFKDILKAWGSDGMAPIKDLRKAEIESGQEAQRKKTRKDQRNKNNLFYVKRLNKVHLWLLDVIDAVAMQPFKYVRLRPEEDTKVTITTDASPLGLGGVLAYNGVVVKYFEAPVTPTVANHFGTKYGEAASQGAMEALALLVALFHWQDALASHVTVTLQSDSVVALAMAEKLSGKSPALNRLGAEMAYRLEEMGLQSLRAVHVPGAANKVADYLSRPHEREGGLPAELAHAKGPAHPQPRNHGTSRCYSAMVAFAHDRHRLPGLAGLLPARPTPLLALADHRRLAPLAADAKEPRFSKKGDGPKFGKESEESEPNGDGGAPEADEKGETLCLRGDADRGFSPLTRTMRPFNVFGAISALYEPGESAGKGSGTSYVEQEKRKERDPSAAGFPAGLFDLGGSGTFDETGEYEGEGFEGEQNGNLSLHAGLPFAGRSATLIVPTYERESADDFEDGSKAWRVERIEILSAVGDQREEAVPQGKKLQKQLLAVAASPGEALERERGTTPLPLTSEVLEGTAAAFKEAGYKSAEMYLVELKLVHVEAGFPWTHTLQRTLDLCKKAVRRNRGPRNKAPEVELEAVTKAKPTKNWAAKKGRLAFPKESFLFGAVWILREDELENLEVSDVRIEDKLVFVYLATSKTDIEAEGTLRVLQCRCLGKSCRRLCPKRVSLDLVAKASTLHKVKATKGGQYLSPLNTGLKASKAQTVKSWKDCFHVKVTGHSARRSGALYYIRSGYALEQVKFLGRWKSDVVLGYAAEALEERPALSGETSGKRKAKDNFVDQEATLEMHTRLFKELKDANEEFKADLQENFKKFTEVAKFDAAPKDSAGVKPALINRKVCSGYSGLVHDMDMGLAKETPHLWKTKCGWPYGFSNFTYVVNEEQPTTCRKCRALRKEVDEGTAAASVKVPEATGKVMLPEKTLHQMLHHPA
ncbi:unnamed protein product [Symbiodinium sp. CCMP2592]|nr:unnamed protein product [Symbiodinium sp. CCMP2592]